MAWFKHRPSLPTMPGNSTADELLACAQKCRAQGELVAAQALAREALEPGVRALAERPG